MRKRSLVNLLLKINTNVTIFLTLPSQTYFILVRRNRYKAFYKKKQKKDMLKFKIKDFDPIRIIKIKEKTGLTIT